MGDKFVFPSNVKQIGSIDDDMKIYVEDYAYTYICQYARAEAYKEKLAVLVGKYIKAEGKNVVLISGVIQSKYSENISGNEVFTEDAWEYIKTRKERYFKDTEIIGWLHTQPGNGLYVPEEDKIFHKENFPKDYHVLFLMDATERMDAFFIMDHKGTGLKELDGYFIYYDKNDEMQEYMLDNKLVKSRSSHYKEEEEEEVTPKEDVAISYRRKDKEKKVEVHQKKLTNLLVGTSSIVVMLCFFMGLLLLQNAQRMNKLEQELLAVNKVYKEVFADNANDAKTTPVFASQEESYTQKQSEPTKEEEALFIEKQTKPPAEKESIPATQNGTQESTVAPTTAPTVAATTAATTAPTTAPKVVEKTTLPVATKKSIPGIHVVKSGDTLSWISAYYYGTNGMVESIMKYNNIKNADKVYEGMRLKLPQN